MEKLQVMMCIS